MKASIRDVQTLRSLRPLEVAAYLRAVRWREVRSVPNRSATWIYRDESGNEFEVVLPLDTGLGDFALRMEDVLATLEVVEERSQLSILEDLSSTSADLVRVRVGSGAPSDGSIGIDEGVQLVHGARDMMMAAACAAVERRKFFPTRKPAAAQEYVRQLRLGQTERGSYVVTIMSRVPPALASRQADHLFEIDEPFERKVTHTLSDALSALRSAADVGAASGDMAAFDKALDRGANGNLCDAITGMSRTGEDQKDIEISFSWSRTRPVDQPTPSKVTLRADAILVIKEAGRNFRETSPREEFELRGPVVTLHRPEGATAGKVTVLGFVDDQPRKVSFELEGEDYDRAIQAHREQRVAVCYGVLIREGRSYQLEKVRDFVPEEET